MPNVLHLEKLADVVRYHITADSVLDMACFWHPCGTFGCIAGWAAHDPYFKDLGLEVLPGSYAGNRAGVLVLWRRKDGKPYAYRDFDALETLFELDDYQACYLFGNNPESTGCDLIEDWDDALLRIQEVIRGDV